MENNLFSDELARAMQRQALGHYLSDWSRNMDLWTILEELNTGSPHESIIVGEPFEDFPFESVAEMIEEFYNSLFYIARMAHNETVERCAKRLDGWKHADGDDCAAAIRDNF